MYYPKTARIKTHGGNYYFVYFRSFSGDEYYMNPAPKFSEMDATASSTYLGVCRNPPHGWIRCDRLSEVYGTTAAQILCDCGEHLRI